MTNQTLTFGALAIAALPAAAGLLALRRRRPDLLLIALLILRSASDLGAEVMLGPLNLPNWVGVLAILLHLSALPGAGLQAGRFSVAWLVFLAYATLVFLAHPTPQAFSVLGKLFAIWALFELAVEAEHARPGRHVFELALLGAVVIPAAAGAYQWYAGAGIIAHNTRYATDLSIYGTFTRPNSFAFVLAYALAALYPQPLRLAWPLHASIWAVLAALLIKTYTKLGWLALAVFLYARAFLARERAGRFALLVLGAVMAAGLGAAAQQNLLPARLMEDVEYARAGQFEWIGSGRVTLWAANLAAYAGLSLPRKLFGMGFETTYENASRSLGVELQAHSDFVRLLYESGLIGFALWSVLLSFALAAGARAADPGSRAQHTAFLLMGVVIFLFDNSLTTAGVAWIFWGMAGAMVARAGVSARIPVALAAPRAEGQHA